MFSAPGTYLEYSHRTHEKFSKGIRKKSFPSKSAKTKISHGELDTDFPTFFMEFFLRFRLYLPIYVSYEHNFIIGTDL